MITIDRATEQTELAASPALRRKARRLRKLTDLAFHAAMIAICAAWLAPVALLVMVSVRTQNDITGNGLGAIPSSFSLSSFGAAWNEGGEKGAIVNSLVVAVPVVVLELFLGSLAAFALARFAIPGRRSLLLLMLAGNLLPPQILLIPIYTFTQQLGIYDTRLALIIVQVGFGIGFFSFVLHGFMRGIPRELQQAALVDGASVVQIYARIIMPLTRPALAALGALAFTWAFNDMLFAITVLTSSSKMPVTPTLLGLQGNYVSQWNVIAAGTLIAAVPTVLVFLRYQRYFIGGLMLGAVK
ncbi:multiple sugar transport system permease protein [Kribbella aluminosa]|uniref:Multiple sugar transport system permease protein n=1 Tax=Kribbella aluminosa TaxID=416017 RepID=A0ABS4UWP7_9ACTN|nr:carbohydrate ABC transporter permease [Kribbella aluminosa]MBP2356055.1 multiple sugar transport system permease protein [Kribbella aluminosa]